MGLTLSHQSALDITRTMRSEGVDMRRMDYSPLSSPSPWTGERWTARTFKSEQWGWQEPSEAFPLDVLVPKRDSRVRMANVNSHTVWQDLPPYSVLWIDEAASVVCPELLFLQMAEKLSLPALVMLGNELCGYFARSAKDPLEGHVTDHVPPATSVEHISRYVNKFKYGRGLARAREALPYVCDDALSAPEALLAMLYSLPTSESGYGMGPVTLNMRVNVSGDTADSKARFPDLMFPFAPVGINYDGEDHLDLDGIITAMRVLQNSDKDHLQQARDAFQEKKEDVRAKVVDDNVRNRELASRGYLVLPATKEDLYKPEGLDILTRQLLSCARIYFGVDTTEFERALDDTERTRDRCDLLESMLPMGRSGGLSHGRI